MIEAPREALGGRYHFRAPFVYQEDTVRWLARDERTGEDVVVALVETARASKLESIKGFAHPHITALVDVVYRFDAKVVPGGHIPVEGALLVAEYVSGPTLRQQLGGGPLNPARAVAWWLRLARAVAEVHEKTGVLGGISPFSIVTKAEGRAIPPVLTQLVAPVVGATLSPERLKGNTADATDDVWALYASLYWALTGVAPFPGNSREQLLKDMSAGPPTPLSAFGLRDKELEEIMKRGLTGDSAQRAVDIQELVKSLDAWERGWQLPPRPRRGLAPRSLSGIVKGGLTPPAQLGRVAFDAAHLPDEFHADLPSAVPGQSNAKPMPPVAPADAIPAPDVPAAAESSPGIETSAAPAVPAPIKRHSVNPFAKKKSAWPVLLGLCLVLGAVAAFFSMNRSGNADAAPSAVAALSSRAPEPAAASSTPPASHSPTQSLNACVRSYFADDTFAVAAQLEFVCESGDHRNVTTKLFELSEAKADLERQQTDADAGAPKAEQPDGGFQVDTVKAEAGPERVRRPLGWYELLSTAIIRKGCCPNAAPVTLPETTGWCEQLQDVVRDLADDSARSGDLAPRVKRFDKAVDCLFANRVRRPYTEYKTAPLTEENRAAFQQFLSHAAVSDAQRRTLQR